MSTQDTFSYKSYENNHFGHVHFVNLHTLLMGWGVLSGSLLHSRLRGCGLESHQGHCVVFLSKAH